MEYYQGNDVSMLVTLANEMKRYAALWINIHKGLISQGGTFKQLSSQ